MSTGEIIAVDTSHDTDDQYESGLESDTTSLASSIRNYTYENGRRYHAFKSGSYALPNDETEQDRLDMMHHIALLQLDGELHMAPLHNPQRVLDIGTGTGIWAIDFADQYPSAEVIGTDLSPIQPGWVPANCQFLVDDAEAPWMFSNDTFDYIHVRDMVGSLADWGAFLKQCYAHLKPGGYVELWEFDNFSLMSDDDTISNDAAVSKYFELINQASEKTGRLFTLKKPLDRMVEDAGFLPYEVVKLKFPMGTWPSNRKMKELGGWFLLVAESGFEAYGIALLTRVLGMDVKEAQDLIEGCKMECRNRKIHGYAIKRVARCCAETPGRVVTAGLYMPTA